jgi:alkyldihydroxyacetonephosphate synthase
MKQEDAFYPHWTCEPPTERTYRSIFKWGDPKGFKHPNARLYRLLKEKLNMTDSDFAVKKRVGDEEVRISQTARLSDEQIDAFRRLVGKENVEQDDFARARFATGKTTEEAMMLRQQAIGPVADLVAHPRDKHDVAAIVRYCSRSEADSLS